MTMNVMVHDYGCTWNDHVRARREGGHLQTNRPQKKLILPTPWSWTFVSRNVRKLISVFYFFFLFYFIFKLYNIVLVLPNIEMNPPQVYMCSPSQSVIFCCGSLCGQVIQDGCSLALGASPCSTSPFTHMTIQFSLDLLILLIRGRHQ